MEGELQRVGLEWGDSKSSSLSRHLSGKPQHLCGPGAKLYPLAGPPGRLGGRCHRLQKGMGVPSGRCRVCPGLICRGSVRWPVLAYWLGAGWAGALARDVGRGWVCGPPASLSITAPSIAHVSRPLNPAQSLMSAFNC